jgi:hypothetical protein
MIDGPFKFLGCYEEFAEESIYACLARIQTCCRGNLVLVGENIS